MATNHPVLVIDNGGYSLKAMYIPDPSNTTVHSPRQIAIPNCVGAASYAGRGIIGEQLFTLPHFHGFMVRRPVDRGFIVDAALQSYIWEYLLQYFAVADESEVELMLTVPFAAPQKVSEVLCYLLTQRFKFRSVTFVSATFLALTASASRDWMRGSQNDSQRDHAKTSDGRVGKYCGDNSAACDASEKVGVDGGCGIVVDFGFSATTVVPYIDFLPVKDSTVRVDVGGKLLSNRLKELISFTQVNMQEDGWLVNHIMERCCYVELNPLLSLQEAAKEKRLGCEERRMEQRYYLPTIAPLMPLGYHEEELEDVLSGSGSSIERNSLQHITFRHEAFLIPELLFHPTDVGILQMGVVEAIVRGTCSRGALKTMPTVHKALLRRIIAFGGVGKFPNLRRRLEQDVRKELDTDDSEKDCLGGTNNRTVQELVEMCVMERLCVISKDQKTAQLLHDSELQPLYGAFALLLCPMRKVEMELVNKRSRVDLIPLRRQKMGKRALSSIKAAVQNVL
ncbi:putative actin-like protein [Trypanosoma vivax]|nr:putative actin-like protein [Trypanosoma vivax]